MSILVVGSLNMDTTYELDHLPLKGETILAKYIKSNRGGKGQNQAVAAARLGSDVILVGAVGDDDGGRLIKKGLSEDNINTDYIITKDTPTGCASIYIDKNGNNNIVVYSGSNFELNKADIESFNKFKNIKYCIMQLEIPLDTVYRTLEICKKNNIITILNPAPANTDFNSDYLKYVDYFIPNETELSLIANEKAVNENIEKLCRNLLKKGVKNVIVTLGEKGSVLVNNNEIIKVPCGKTEAVDTTAAGDSYIGGFVTYLSEGKSLKESMEFASKVAAKTVSKKGAIDSLPYRNNIK